MASLIALTQNAAVSRPHLLALFQYTLGEIHVLINIHFIVYIDVYVIRANPLSLLLSTISHSDATLIDVINEPQVSIIHEVIFLDVSTAVNFTFIKGLEVLDFFDAIMHGILIRDAEKPVSRVILQNFEEEIGDILLLLL